MIEWIFTLDTLKVHNKSYSFFSEIIWDINADSKWKGQVNELAILRNWNELTLEFDMLKLSILWFSHLLMQNCNEALLKLVCFWHFDCWDYQICKAFNKCIPRWYRIYTRPNLYPLLICTWSLENQVRKIKFNELDVCRLHKQ